MSDDQKSTGVLNAPWNEIHGFLGDSEWAAPKLTVFCDEEARPGYTSRKAHEYLDVPETLEKKVKLMAQLIRDSSNCLAYTGAGISTSAGIGDYASKAAGKNSLTAAKTNSKFSMIDADPTFSHRFLVELYRQKLLKYWIQQNHDGLPQKAGLPQSAINEIHGAWFDPANPVVPMSGSLRGDLMEDLLQWEQKSDLCMAMGTSLCGMNADRVFVTASKKALKQWKKNKSSKGVFGGVIIALQCTQYDEIASLRIFAKLDDVMIMLAKELKIEVPEYKLYALEDHIPSCNDYLVDGKADMYYVKIDEEGYPCADAKKNKKNFTLDLRLGSYVRLTGGRDANCCGTVVGKSDQGHYTISFFVKDGDSHKRINRALGLWWVENAISGIGVVADKQENALFPVVNISKDQLPKDIKESLIHISRSAQQYPW